MLCFLLLQVVSFFQNHGSTYALGKCHSQKMMAMQLKPTLSLTATRKISPIYLDFFYHLRSRALGTQNRILFFCSFLPKLLYCCSTEGVLEKDEFRVCKCKVVSPWKARDSASAPADSFIFSFKSVTNLFI